MSISELCINGSLFVYLLAEAGETGRECRRILQSGSKGVGVSSFALGGKGNGRDTEKRSTGRPNPLRACFFARQDTVEIESDGADINPELDRDSPVLRCRFRPHDLVTTAPKPRDVLTDVVLKLTFDNTAYVEEKRTGASTTGVLPDSLTTYLLIYLLTYLLV